MLAALFFSYLCGLLLAPFLASDAVPTALPFFMALCWFPLRRHRIGLAPLLLFMTLCGVLLYHLHLTPVDNQEAISALFKSEKIHLHGRVVAAVPREGEGLRIDLDQISTSAAVAIPGRVRLYVRKKGAAILAGEEVQVLTRLRPPRNFGIPGEFDMERYLARRKIVAVGHIDSSQNIARFVTTPSLTYRLSRFRQRMAETIDTVAPVNTAPLVKALLLGQKESLPQALRQKIAAAGLSHLFAISGLHFATLSLLLYMLLRSLYTLSERALLFAPPRRILPPLTLPFLVLYLLFTGTALSAQRALLMLTIALILFFHRRRTRPFSLLTAAAFLLLLLDPLALYEPSLQLSLAGVAGILAFNPCCRPYLPRQSLLRGASLLFCTTFAATLATFPLILHHFHLFAPAGLLLNLVAVPLVAMLALPLGLAGILIAPFWPAMTEVAIGGCGHILSTVLSLTETTLSLPILAERYLFLTLSDQLFLAVLVVSFLFATSKNVKMLMAIPISLAVLYLIPSMVPQQPLSLTALSVGQGDATLLQLGSDHFLIDSGGFRNSRFDSGERLIVPALARLGVRKLEGVILSHDHPDHAGGLPFLLKHFPINHFYAATPARKLTNHLGEILQEQNIPFSELSAGWSSTTDSSGATLAFFVPDQGHPNKNERSVAVYAGVDSHGLLLTGDLGAPGIEQLLASKIPGPVDLLKIPHHGSRFSPLIPLLERLKPQQTFVSAGYDNPYSLPHPTRVKAIKKAGLPLWRTDLQGSLEFTFKDRNWLTRQWNKSLFR